jgi:nitrate reductase (NAD(P)H)
MQEQDSDHQSSSSDDFGASTPPSSIHSDINKSEPQYGFEKLKNLLPNPFFPPSLSQQELPRELPGSLRTPQVPLERACSRINTQDTYVESFASYRSILRHRSHSGTPDDWVPRDPRLVRLTGKHPLNCEAKLNDLFASGFLTPNNLFYVRNHGAVPRVASSEAAMKWKLEIHG